MRYFFLTMFQMNLLATVVFMMIQFQRVLFKNSTSSWWCRQYKIVVLLFLLPFHNLFLTYLSQPETVSQNIGNYHKTSDDFANILEFAPYIWVIGVIVLGFYQIIAYFKFKSLFSFADLVSDKNLLNLLSNEKSKFNYYYDIPLYSWSILDTPIVVGIVQPKLIITENKLSDESYQQIFSHEINHIKSCDNFWKLLTKIATILHFYNPIVYWFAKKFVEEMEFTCDENVVKDLSFSQKKTYCLTLIESVSVVNNTINLSSSFSPNKKSLEQRLTNIMKCKQMRTTTKVISSFILICVTYIMLLFTSSNVETQSTQLVIQTSSSILKSEVLPNQYGNNLYDLTTTTTVNGQYTTINQYINSTTIDIDNERGITSMTEANGTGWAYEYSVATTYERPLIAVKHVDENGNYIEQLIDVNAVDPTNCTASEFSALYLHSLEEVESTKSDTLETSHWKASIIGNLSSILGDTNGNMLVGYAKFDDVSNYLADAHSFADFNLSLPYVENNIVGSDIKEVLELLESVKYEYSQWLKL